MEIKRGGQSVIGYPALVDKGAHCDRTCSTIRTRRASIIAPAC